MVVERNEACGYCRTGSGQAVGRWLRREAAPDPTGQLPDDLRRVS